MKRVHPDQPRPKEYNDRSPKGFGLKYGLSLSTVYNILKAGELKALKVRGRTIIPDNYEQEWLESLDHYKHDPEYNKPHTV